MQATNPEGHRQPGTGNSSHSDTDITEPYTLLTRMGMEKHPEHGSGSCCSVSDPTPQMTTGQEGAAAF